ncbi:preprotein translocase subunit SecG [Bermanella sp. R86510]|uniref:preprotein translocase subunit SecG n=1 Tax=unclassified Bermanella TaxID=2627862 RepID=UPI0037CC74CB
MDNIILIFHIVVAIAIIVLVLIQRGKGAEAGASFGGGASQTVFGSAGTGNFLTRSTSILAVVFFATSFSLAYFAKQQADGLATKGLPTMQEVEEVQQPAVETEVPVVEEDDGASDAPLVD